MTSTTIVELLPKHSPRLIEAESDSESFESGGQLFTRAQSFGGWLGFYDWLRTQERAIVGVRLRSDDPATLTLFEPFVGPDVTIEGGAVSIRTSSEGLAVDALSDDADFGGNVVFYGNAGGLAIAFFSPRVR